MALLRLTIAQGAGMKRRGGGKLTLKDFLPDYCLPPQKELTDDEAAALIEAQFAEFIVNTPPPNTPN